MKAQVSHLGFAKISCETPKCQNRKQKNTSFAGVWFAPLGARIPFPLDTSPSSNINCRNNLLPTMLELDAAGVDVDGVIVEVTVNEKSNWD